MYELLIGIPLFPIPYMSQEETDDSHLLLMISQLGPLPESLISQWPRSHTYFHPNREQFNSMVDGSEAELINYDSLETRFREEKSSDINEKEEEIVIDLLRSALRYEPDMRPSAEQLLSHPWFSDETA